MRRLAVFLCLAFTVVLGQSFEAFLLKSGMTPEDLPIMLGLTAEAITPQAESKGKVCVWVDSEGSGSALWNIRQAAPYPR